MTKLLVNPIAYISKVRQQHEKNNFLKKVTVADIHKEFDTATERLLNEAKAIIAKNDKSKIDKAERLKAIGFHNSLPVKQTAEQVLAAEESKKKSELIMYYQQWYPFNKFITENEVERICEKYNLVFGESERYIGDIPEVNLREIERFKLRKEDRKKRECGYYKYWTTSGRRRHYRHNKISNKENGAWGYINKEMSLVKVGENIKCVYEQLPFKICAPINEFDTRYLTVIEGYKLVLIKDPIVLQPVNDGYLIVSKWGLESKDDTLLNEKLN